MKNLTKAALAALMLGLVCASGTQAFAEGDTPDLPNATVKEVTDPARLTVELSEYEPFVSLKSGSYTMNKAVEFSTTYTDDDAGKTAMESDLEKYGDWLCDFRITIESPEGKINGDDVVLIGNYGTWGNVGFAGSRYADTVVDGEYYIINLVGGAVTYYDVVNYVKNFTCGVVDVENKLPVGTIITNQLVMYDPDKPETKYEIGDSAYYEKCGAEIIDVDAYKVEDGTGNLRFITKLTAKQDDVQEFGTWIVSENYFTEDAEPAVKLTSSGDVANVRTFTADIMNIPSDKVGTAFYAKSYIKTQSGTQWSDVKEATVNGNLNYTSYGYEGGN